MNKAKSPERWAIDLSILLTTSLGRDRFPVDVSDLAMAYSQQVFPDDPVTRVVERHFEGFEGALIARGGGGNEWGIGYSSTIASKGRVNFTIAHEFGHYLLHRHMAPEGLQCRPEDMARWDSEYNQIEAEANLFAAGLLMPLDDFRLQIPGNEGVGLNELGNCAERYEVSLMAATLRWLSYTQKRAILVVVRDGFILWARSSAAAFRTGAFIKVLGRPPIEIPISSPAALRNSEVGIAPLVEHTSGVWLPEPVTEHALVSERYDLSLSLLTLANNLHGDYEDEEPTEDLLDQYGRLLSRR